MKCKEIIEVLEKRYPPSLAAEWDNVGLLVGDAEKEVRIVYTALDLTDTVLERAVSAGADLIVTHHPMIFRPVSGITRQDFIGRRIMGLIEHGISYYAMHTNFDIAGMADRNARDLQLENPEVLECVSLTDDIPVGYGRVGNVSGSPSLGEFARNVKKIYALDAIRVYGDETKPVHRAAVSSGSGKSSLRDAIKAGADVLITGDVDYHTAIDAVMQGIAVIDAGHYGTEYCFIGEAASFLESACPGITAVRDGVQQPYRVF